MGCESPVPHLGPAPFVRPARLRLQIHYRTSHSACYATGMTPLPTIEPAVRGEASPPPLPPYHVEVKFAANIDGDTQGRLMLAWERLAREAMGVPVELYKSTRVDDLVRRRDMTSEDRGRL